MQEIIPGQASYRKNYRWRWPVMQQINYIMAATNTDSETRAISKAILHYAQYLKDQEEAKRSEKEWNCTL